MASVAGAIALFLAFGAGAAAADDGFGLKDLDVTFTTSDGAPDLRAGSHPFAWTTTFGVNTRIDSDLGEVPIEAVKNLRIELPPGLVGDPRATQRCSATDFADVKEAVPACANSTVVGITTARIGVGAEGPEDYVLPVYNLVPPPGAPAKFGFVAVTVPVTFVAKVSPDPPYNLVAHVTNIPQPLRYYGSEFTIWGNPADPDHDLERGSCAGPGTSDLCPADIPERPFLTLPRSCSGPLRTSFAGIDSWQNPGRLLLPYVTETHDNSVPPQPLGTIDCDGVNFGVDRISSQPTTDRAESPTGLDFQIEIEDEGLTSPSGIARSDVKKAVVTLPEGVTANPSAAEGLAACSEADLKREAADSEPGEGCPQASKIGTVEVETPLLEGELITGEVFLATPRQNPFGTLLALYMVIKDRELGILVKLPGKVEPDPRTGQLVTTFGEGEHELPQIPFSRFRFHLREGGRSLLITPPGCGAFETKAVFTPWANPSNPFPVSTSFAIDRGVDGGPCPPTHPPFAPGFTAGTINNDAGHYSPFYTRLTRRDGDQDLTKFSFRLPPGLVAKLAGVSKCSDGAIALAKAKTGREELASPSCPQGSQVGSVIGGAGVGSQLTYVPGKIYLAGPYNRAPLSAVGIVPAVAGPFDVGTVVVRQALDIDPRTTAARLDGARSDPIPHILAGIPLEVRDIRINVDKPDFALNPTNCDPFAVEADLWGGGADVFSTADDSPVAISERFQAANCARLGFKPQLGLRLKGGTKRGDHPALRAVYRPRLRDANIRRLALTFPRSEFVENANFRTICTRIAFAADNCPKGSIYGHARAFTPLLDEPLKGPVYLRSSSNPLPDAVFALRGLVDVEVVVRIDSVDGRLRTTVQRAPDVPVTKVIVDMQGGKKGLFVNSRNICAGKHRAEVASLGQNGRRHTAHPQLRAGCPKQRRAGRKR